jgi:hypothetical protein
MTTPHSKKEYSRPPKQWGLVAQYESPTDIYHACEKVRDAGYKQWDACVPFPVHGLDKAMGPQTQHIALDRFFYRCHRFTIHVGISNLGVGLRLSHRGRRKIAFFNSCICSCLVRIHNPIELFDSIFWKLGIVSIASTLSSCIQKQSI